MSAIIGIDLGSTTMAGGLVTPDGEVLTATQVPTPRDGRTMDTLVEIVDRLLTDVSARNVDLLGVGVGVPGLIDAGKGMLRSSSSASWIPELRDVPLADRLSSQTGVPAFVDNDVNALALAESTFGLGRGASSLVVLAIGTGIGGGLILNSELVRGTSGYAGEFGHVTVNFRGPLCGVCGGRGCLAAYLDGTQIANQARALLACRPGRDPGVITAAMVFEAAAAGDRLAERIVDEACEALAAGLGAIVNAFNPDIVVVTGGVAHSLAPLEADIVRRLAAYALGPALDATRIAIVPSDKRKTVLGGAALVLYELSRRDRLMAMRPDPLRSAREA
jgi:glucokinase-like ROK family protein